MNVHFLQLSTNPNKNCFIVLFLLLMILVARVEAANDRPEPRVELGAKVYVERCVLCHGSQGMGEGTLTMLIKDYPSANLLNQSKAKTLETIRDAIVYGGTRGELDPLMPPMGADLSWTELESISKFVLLLREDFAKAEKLMTISKISEVPSLRRGRNIFKNRCVLCHGIFGEGDGRMAKIIKDPSPANLRKSKLEDGELLGIITAGGEGTGRSNSMPPWGDQLSLSEIQSLLIFIKDIRD